MIRHVSMISSGLGQDGVYHKRVALRYAHESVASDVVLARGQTESTSEVYLSSLGAGRVRAYLDVSLWHS